jgi:type I restriction enzyme R subunit
MCIESEAQMEQNLIDTLVSNEYEKVDIKDEKSLLANLKIQLEQHNNVKINDDNFKLILNHLSGGTTFEKANKLRDRFPIALEDKTTKHIEFLDSVNWCKNIYQVTNQVTIKGKKTNRYDVTILINGLPLVQIELKKRGIKLSQAYMQINRYQKHSFNENYGLFGYVQMFIISNGANTKYYANNPKPSFKQTFFWANENNEQIRDIKQFATSFLDRCHLSKMICRYTVLTTTKLMMIMRPYQFYAVEKIIEKVDTSNDNAYIWHTTGSGKTLTSFKSAQLLSKIDKIKKVVFVVDRKDLDTQTKQEFNKFKKGSVDGTDNTKELVKQFSDDTALIVTTIQKLNTAISKQKYLDNMKNLVNENIIFIFDECHRSQFGKTHTKIVKFFKKGQMIGFTGTPIMEENAMGTKDDPRTTEQLFDERLHSYVLPDAIGDDNVLGFVVDYRPTNEITKLQKQLDNFTADNKEKIKKEKDGKSKEEKKEITEKYNDVKDSLSKKINDILYSDERISHISNHIIDNHTTYTNNKFTAMMCVSSVDMLIKYYDKFKSLNSDMKIATIFSYSSEEKDGDNIEDGNGASVDESNIDIYKKDKLEEYIKDYNSMFDTNYSTDTEQYYNYYDDISKRVKSKEIDLLIVVNMFLTGFDSPSLNTMYVDKELKHHGLIQAFSRTNRILDGKSDGRVICFRDLQQKVEEAIEMFSDKKDCANVLRNSFENYLAKCITEIEKLRELVPTPDDCKNLKDNESKMEFVKIFRVILELLDTMQTFVEFEWSKLTITQIEIANYTSHYLDIYDEVKGGNLEDVDISEESDLSNVDFGLDLIARDIIDLLYILKLLYKLDDNDEIQKRKIYNIIRATPNIYKKKDVIEEFMIEFKSSNNSVDNIDEEYTKFSNKKKQEELNKFCETNQLNIDSVSRIIEKYIYDGKDMKSDDIAKVFINKLKIMERKNLVPKVHRLIMELIYKFEEM